VTRPSYEIEQRDCLGFLRDLSPNSVDVILADPPYSSGGRGDVGKPPSVKYCQSGQKKTYPEFAGDQKQAHAAFIWSTAWMREARRAVKDQGYILVFTDWRTLPMTSAAIQAAEFVWRGIIAWDKGRAARSPNKAYFRHQCEYIVWGTKGETGRGESGLGPFDGCYQFPVDRGDTKVHICQKPTALLRALLACCPRGGTVVDPFVGSGATAIAAHDLGLSFKGSEVDPHWCSLAKQRLNASSPSDLL
jgi:site-specific DNA-methyltransferase (adenine-specific)